MGSFMKLEGNFPIHIYHVEYHLLQMELNNHADGPLEFISYHMQLSQ